MRARSNTIRHILRSDAETGLWLIDRGNLHTRPDGKLFSLSRLRAKTKAREVLVRDMLSADDDAALVAHSLEQLQRLMDGFSRASLSFGLTISLKKTKAMAKGAEPAPRISISDYWL